MDLKKRCIKYRLLSEKAIKKAKIAIAETGSMYIIAEDFINMAKNYISDGKYSESKGDYDVALASYSYAHAWLDAGARLGLFDVKKDTKLFTLFREGAK